MNDQFKQARFVLPVLEDANAIQMALMQVMQMLTWGQMDHKTAGLLLYALQTASYNLRRTKFEAWATDVVIDRDGVNSTRIGGPQWLAEDFKKEKAEEGAAGVEEDEVEEIAAKPAAEEEIVSDGDAEAAVVKSGKIPAHGSVEEPRERVRSLIQKWIMDTAEAKARRELTQGAQRSGLPAPSVALDGGAEAAP